MIPKQDCEATVVAKERKEGLAEAMGLLSSAEAIRRIAKKSSVLTTHIYLSVASFATSSADGYCGPGVADEIIVKDVIATERVEADFDEMRNDEDIVSTPREENGLEEMASCCAGAGVARDDFHDVANCSRELGIAEGMKDIEEAILETLGMCDARNDTSSAWTETMTLESTDDYAVERGKKEHQKMRVASTQIKKLEAMLNDASYPSNKEKMEEERGKLKESSAQIKKLEALLNDVFSPSNKEKIEEERENFKESSTQIKKVEALLTDAASPSKKEKMEEERENLKESITQMKKVKALLNDAKLIKSST